MDLGVVGATGTIGGRVVAEGLRRGHRIRAFTRDASRIPPQRDGVVWQVADVRDGASATDVIGGLDVVVNAINAGRDVPEAIANASTLVAAARALLTAMEDRPRTRLLVVGGAGSLEVAPGLQVVDTEGFAEQLPEVLGVPPEYIAVVRAHREALDVYRLSNRNWTYLSPSAGLIHPGKRTGRFRTGGDRLLVRADGTSDISAEDLAVAVLDEIEVPRHVQRRFTVGY